ncbi:MAG: restriction endonuclease subunit S [Ruminococcus sp.]|nr:restriction endonuclease subunit S [Ruminococcus sp.]MCM1381938.1 restriction endonuclease subunit S [Muribaculaceae bacterium]MCM1479788.1 restriction endonuclease subunit S [Muribaculaceae bacterium]
MPWITSSAVNNDFISKANDYLTEIAIKETNCKVFPKGTLIVAMYGEGKTRGMCAELNINAATNQAVAAIIIDDNSIINRDYLKWFITLNYYDLRRKAVGGVQPNLNLNIIKNYKIPLFSPLCQDKIVKKIELRLSICDNMEKAVDAALSQAEAMRQSILKKAFEGELL